MKTSTRALLGTACAIVGLMVILAVAARLWLDPIPEDAVPDPGPTVERRFDIADFEGINVSGAWRVKVSRGENTVSVRAPEGYFDRLVVERRHGILFLEHGRIGSITHLVATVSTSNLTSIDGSGAARVALNDVETHNLAVNLSGAARIVSSGGRVGRLELVSSGAGRIDFSGTPTKDVHAQLSGSSKVELRMDGGRLEGVASGASTVRYRGDVSSLEIETSGASRVRRK